MKLLLLTGLLLAMVFAANATRIEFGKNKIIDKPVYEDLYIAGADITINAPVHGDLIIAGGTITINDTVTNDILVAGGRVTFNGYVGDDIRCAGGNLMVMNNVAGDLVITGGTITIKKGITLGGLMASGGEITMNGSVAGPVSTMAGTLLLNGTAQKNIDCKGGKITINGTVQGPAVLAATDEIVIGNSAAFEKGVRYWSRNKRVDFKQSVKAGEAVYDPSLRMQHNRWYYLGFASVVGLIWYVGMVFLMIALVQYLFGNSMKKAADTAYNKALRSLGYGVLYWIGVPFAAAVACLTVIGVPLGVIVLLAYIVLLLLSTVITSVLGANWLNNRSATNWRYWRIVFVSLGIFIVLKILSFTPFLGWLILIVLTCIAFGALLQNINWRRVH